ncbi:MAG TPA: glycosyltransferase family 4 protein [Balneolales bacterium]|nr:glycosyltransferase family 4 protein [Balneolales bacterium]
MLIGLLHYHLRGGGVTRVIESTVTMLKEHGHDVIVVCGEKTESECIDQLITHDALRYDVTPDNDQLRSIADDLEKETKRRFGRVPDLWHFHNHSLGKNTTAPLLVSHWAKKQTPVLLQIHDFAEDGRASNYQFLTRNMGKEQPIPLYPQAPHIHYATLTRRDQRILSDAGFQDDLLHILPNPVSLGHGTDQDDNARSLFPECETLILYPVRGIRRKNIGEFLLHSIIASPDTHFAMTLGPKNPKQQAYYQKWVAFARMNNLPVTFEAGHQQEYSFPSVVQAADLLMTSSITEGFGLTFLEAWLADRPIGGRDLPEITGDFKEKGIVLSHLYSTLPVPLDWLPKKKFEDKVENALKQMYHQYGREYRKEYLQQFLDAALQNENVDFGRLDEELQRIVLDKLLTDSGAGNILTPCQLQKNIPDTDTTMHNKKLVKRYYSPDAFYERLINIYEMMIDAPPGPVSYANPELVMDQFLKPDRFYLLKSE